MINKTTAWLFLPHQYSKAALRRFVSLLDTWERTNKSVRSMLVAVDGGYEFFRKSGRVADLLIGDFDSLVPFPARLPAETLILPFPRRKDKTDTELAIQYALKSGVREIHLILPEIGEVDQFFGVVMPLTSLNLRQKKISMTIWTPTERIWLLRNGRSKIVGKKGDLLSIIPLSSTLELSWKGTAFDVNKLRIKRGESAGLRNELRAKSAQLTIRGEGLVVHRDVSTKPETADNP